MRVPELGANCFSWKSAFISIRNCRGLPRCPADCPRFPLSPRNFRRPKQVIAVHVKLLFKSKWIKLRLGGIICLQCKCFFVETRDCSNSHVKDAVRRSSPANLFPNIWHMPRHVTHVRVHTNSNKIQENNKEYFGIVLILHTGYCYSSSHHLIPSYPPSCLSLPLPLPLPLSPRPRSRTL